MAPISGAAGLLASGLAPVQKPGEDPKRVAQAAGQFEALLIGQMLKSMHESDGGGWTGTDNDDAGSQAVALAEEQLAQAIANHGGLGLARLVAGGLQKTDAAPQKLQP